jgi:hypothetical protein
MSHVVQQEMQVCLTKKECWLLGGLRVQIADFERMLQP